ncbi:MAG: YihY/virulence factor BrkB family protein [Deltaproteobacteria bacterium]|nr:YihY/virulence factor BrkB family protein [Deltaproteobacteria bacterium]
MKNSVRKSTGKKRPLIFDIIDFFQVGIWRMKIDELPRIKALFIRMTRVITLALRGFVRDNCSLRASALTLYTLLSIVPVAAMAFGIAKGFGFEKRLQELILKELSGQQEVAVRVIDFARSMLENTRGGIIAGIGVVFLLWTVIKVLGNIESAFNHIWKVEASRTFLRKISDYLSIMLICPILVIISSSATVFITTQITAITTSVALPGMFNHLIFFVLRLAPYCLIWILLTFVYLLMPNTRVRFKSGLIAGIAAGTVFQILQLGYIYFQVGVTRFNAIYGSFAALPLFLIWLQLSWLIVLGGAEMSCAHQKVDHYEFKPDFLDISTRLKKLLALQIAHLIITRFARGKPPLTAGRICKTLQLPIHQVRQLLDELTESRILSTTGNAPAFQPAMDIQRLSINRILSALENRGNDALPPHHGVELKAIAEALNQFNARIDASPENRLLKDI